eukprot:TRINITY_DN17630_c0_g1_i1.p1 TRINITY_DN17630_c0_g1~~TRINITY_DN17630_c0_g1_i1.p1  ORF type:complete len:200 (-),score=42.38 TRINITY_DN17630_c0_g1_i1:318-851(-)
MSADITPDELKKEGNELYVKNDFQGAIKKYSEAIKIFEAEKSDEPTAPEDRKILSVLYSNRAQATLAELKQSHAGKQVALGAEPPREIKLPAMRAISDASQAIDLDANNSKAYLRKGQALLCLSTLQQRAKEALRCLQQANEGNLPQSLKAEAAHWQKQAQLIFDNETPMPDQCSVM